MTTRTPAARRARVIAAAGPKADACIILDRIHCVDALTGLKRLPENSVDCILTSPPYWGTRDYGLKATTWPDGVKSVLGLEPHPDLFIVHLCEVFDAAKRVLKEGGTLWVNLGDAYHHVERVSALRARAPPETRRSSSSDVGLAEKSLCLIPERFVLEMIRRGWILRNRIVWHKSNHMPTNVRDRLACSWEHLFFLVKSRKYHFDLDAIRVPHLTKSPTFTNPAKSDPDRHLDPRTAIVHHRLPPKSWSTSGRNPADCWTIAASTGRDSHPASFPPRLCERPILAGCPEGGLVLDPFMGSGTTALAARRLGRRFLGFDMNPSYVKLARNRLAAEDRAQSLEQSAAPIARDIERRHKSRRSKPATSRR